MRKLGLLSLALAASPAYAECMSGMKNGVAPGSEENRAQAKLEKKIAERFADDQNQSALYFVVGDGEIIRVPVNPEKNQTAIPAAVAKKLSQYDRVKVFNHLGEGNHAYTKSLYFVPYSEAGLKSMKPQADFTEARQEERWAGPGCTFLNLKGRETLTLLHNNIARSADKVTAIHRNNPKASDLSEQEKALLKESIESLNRKLATIPGANRAPASGSQSPVYDVKRQSAKSTNAGTTTPAGSGAKKQSATGN